MGKDIAIELDTGEKDTSSSFSIRLKQAMAMEGVNQTELASKIGVTAQTIQYLCSGKAKRSRYSHELARTLAVNPVWLAYGEGKIRDNIIISSNSTIIVPVLDWKCCTDKYHIQQAIDLKNYSSTVNVDTDLSEASFALKIQDDSMSPKFDEDTIVVFDPTVEPQHKSYVLALIKHNKKTYFRQYMSISTGAFLKPLDPIYDIIDLEQDHEILGVLKQAVFLP